MNRKGWTLVEIMIATVIAVILFAAVVLVVRGDNEDVQSKQVSDVQTQWEGQLRENLKTVCIGGFEYYFSSYDSVYRGRAIMAPVFDKQDRLPKRCTR